MILPFKLQVNLRSCRKTLLVGAALALAGCAGHTGLDPVSAITLRVAQPYYVDVASVTVDSKYKPLAGPQDVSLTLPVPLDRAVRTYAQQRFRPDGAEGKLHIVIGDASVILDHLVAGGTFSQWFGHGDQDRYTAVVKLDLIRESAHVRPGAMGASLRAERTLTIPAGIPLAERDARLRELTTEIIGDIDNAATDSLLNTLKITVPAGDIAPSPGPHPPIPVERASLLR